MVCFGVLSIYFSQKASQGDKNAWVFALCQTALWTTRVSSELILPVSAPLFFLSNPTMIIAIFFFLPILILLPKKQGKA